MNKIFLICFFVLFSRIQFEIFNYVSEISLTIKGIGNQLILSNKKPYDANKFTEFPEEVIINNITQTISTTNIYYLPEEINTIKMKWINTQVTSCDGMFYQMENITSIDLSKFDSSLITQANYMFSECSSLKYLNLKGFNTSKITSMKKMFNFCKSLEFLDLSDFNTSLVNNMNLMFKNCQSLKLIDLRSFDTSLVTDMDYLFESCKSIKSLDLSNFYTPSLEAMSNMFYGCSSLEYLNIKNFDTSKVTSLGSLFYNCYSLISVNLSHFNTSLVTSLNNMFNNCSSLLYLDLSNFDTKKVTDVSLAFSECNSLLYLNIINFDLNLVTSSENIIKNTNLNLIYCLNLENINTDIKTQFESYNTMKNECSNNCFNFNYKLIPSKGQCIEKCNDDTQYKYEFNNICYEQCPYDTYIISEDDNICKEELYCGNYFYNFEKTECIEYIPIGYYLNNSVLRTIDKCDIKCFECNLESSFYHLCISCNLYNGFYPKENDSSNADSFINCYNEEQEGYYLDLNEKIFKIKNSSEEVGDSNKIEESENGYEIGIEEKNVTNIESGLNNKTIDVKYISSIIISNSTFEENESTLFSNNIISNEIYKTELEQENILCNIKKMLEKKCIITTKEEKTISNQNIIDELINGLLTEIIEEIKGNNSDYFIETEKEVIQISLLSKQNKTKNSSYINLNELEEKIKKDNNISLNDDIILLKIEHYIEVLNFPLIEYSIFSPDGKRQLNLDSFKNNKIELSIPVSINEKEEYKYNPNSTFYNDICHIHTTEENTDITLYDRKGVYNKNKMSLCEINCTYLGYDHKNKKAKCECPIKTNFNFFLNEKIDVDKLLYKFINVKSLLNFDIVKCHNVLFSKNGLINNIGSYLTLFIILLSLFLSIIFCLSGFNLLFSQMKSIAEMNNNIKEKQLNTKNYPPKKRKKRIKKEFKKINFSSMKTLDINKELKGLDAHPIITSNNKNEIKNKNKEKLNEINSRNEFNDYELNSLNYKDALEIDNRTFSQYYISLIRTKQLIIFTFYTKTDYNSRIIKINLFFFFLILYFAINAIFFNDSTMHQIYEDKGKFNFLYQIPQMFYSTMISAFIKFIIEKLSLTEKNILEIKQAKVHEKALEIMNKTLTIIKIKFVLYFIINFLFLFLFWYYLSSFCAIYRNTQMYLFKDTIISFCGSLFYPFVINILPGCLRIKAIHCKEKNRVCLYQISKIFQII